MKTRLFTCVVLAQILLSTTVCAKDNDTLSVSKSYFHAAKQELEKMLSGKNSLSYERAVYLIENAYWDNQIDSNIFKQVIDYNTEVIKQMIASNSVHPAEIKADNFWDELRAHRNKEKGYHEKALMNWGIYNFMTDTVITLKEGNVSYIVNKEPLRYSTQDPLGTTDWTNTQVTHLLQYGNGNCFALASLYKIFSERLKSNADICTAPGHIFITHQDDKGTYYNIELSSRTFPGTGTLETLTYTTDEAVKNGISMRQLNLQQSVALSLVYLAKGYEYKYKTRGDRFALECAELALQYDSLNLNAMLLKAEVWETAILNKKENVAQLQMDKTFKEYEYLLTKLYRLGYREMPYEMKNVLINGWTRDTNVTIVATEHKPNTFDHLGVKHNRYASLSWGLFDEEMRDKPLERYSRTIFNTKTKTIKEFGREEVLYNDYNFDPVVFAWNVDPLAHKMPGWSPYAFCMNNPILMFDPDGAFPYTIHIRAFAPFDYFGGGFHGDGSKRGYTTSADASARVHQNINFDTDDNKATTKAWSSPTSHRFWPGSKTERPSVKFTDKLKITTSGDVKSYSFGSHVAGANPMVPGAPNIDVFSSFSVSEDRKAGTLNISGSLKGDNFPSTEAFITDPSGQNLFIGIGFYEGSPFSSLDGENQRDITDFNFTVTTDKKGNFTGVKQGDKSFTISDWNQQFQKADPNKKE